MKKIYSINGIDCANCAAKLEDKMNKIKGIREVTLNFMMCKLTVEADCTTDEKFEEIMNEIRKIAKKMEPDVVID